MFLSAEGDDKRAGPILELIAVVATGANTSPIEGLAEVGGVEACIVDLVLSTGAVDIRGNALSVDNGVGYVLAGGAGSGEVIILVAGRVDGDAAAEVEVLA